VPLAALCVLPWAWVFMAREPEVEPIEGHLLDGNDLFRVLRRVRGMFVNLRHQVPAALCLS
jgi:hypothetical protein